MSATLRADGCDVKGRRVTIRAAALCSAIAMVAGFYLVAALIRWFLIRFFEKRSPKAGLRLR